MPRLPDAPKMLVLLLLAQPFVCAAQSDRDSSRPELNPPLYDGPPPQGQREAVRARREAEQQKRIEDEERRRRAFEAARERRKK